MSIVAFAGDIKVTSTNKGVILSKSGENWGDPWPVPDETLSVTDISSLIRALQQVQQEQNNEW